MEYTRNEMSERALRTAVSVKFTSVEHARLTLAAQRVGWTPTALLRRAAMLAADHICAATDSELAVVMTPLVLTCIRTRERERE